MYLTRLKKIRHVLPKYLPEVVRERDSEYVLKLWLLDDSLPGETKPWSPLQELLRRRCGREWLDRVTGNLLNIYLLDTLCDLPNPEPKEGGQSPDLFVDVLGKDMHYILATHEIARILGVPRTDLPCLVGYVSLSEPLLCVVPFHGAKSQQEVKARFLQIFDWVEQAAREVIGEARVSDLINRRQAEPIQVDEAKGIAQLLREGSGLEDGVRPGDLWSELEDEFFVLVKRISKLLQSSVSDKAGRRRSDRLSRELQLADPAQAVVSGEPVDLQMRVKTRFVGGGLILDYELTSPSGHLDIQSIVAKSERLNVESLEKEHLRLFSGLERLLRGLGEDGETLLNDEIEEELQDRGHELYLRLFPDELKTFYREYRDRIRSLLVLSDEPWIPWELVLPDEFRDDDFLCMRFPMARWFAVPHPPAPAIGVHRLLVAEAAEVAAYPTLRSAREERDMLAGLIEEIPGLDGEILESATVADLRGRLQQGGFDLVHFAGHADYTDGEPERSRLVLTDRPFQTSKLTGKILRSIQGDRPLVFLDACRAARKGRALTGIGGWPDRWVRLGRCGALLCPQWAVRDGAAGFFAETFYRRLRRGATLGEAVLEARRRLRERDPNDPTYLAYSLYGHPNAAVGFAGDETVRDFRRGSVRLREDPPASRERPPHGSSTGSW